jgi:hypothetical protein
MKAYVTTTGALFSLLVMAHIWRAVVEGPSVVKSPIFVASTIIATAMVVWAWRVRRSIKQS